LITEQMADGTPARRKATANANADADGNATK
jgi:hypothetical protein